MDLVDFRDYCLTKPGASEATPFGETVLVFKVGGKMFALLSLDEVPATANLKCDPDLALELRDQFEQVQPGYHMNKKHWNTVEIDSMPEGELRKMIDHSFDLIVNSLPKTKPVAASHHRRPASAKISRSSATRRAGRSKRRSRGE